MHLNKLVTDNYIKNTNWHRINSYINENEEYYYLQKVDGDTLKYFSFYYYPTDNKYLVLELVTRYLYNDTLFEIAYNKRDTLYAFMQISKSGNLLEPISPSIEDKIFISGKYYYLNLYGYLNINQQDYFFEHRDSLIRIRGNDIPDLPEF